MSSYPSADMLKDPSDVYRAALRDVKVTDGVDSDVEVRAPDHSV